MAAPVSYVEGQHNTISAVVDHVLFVYRHVRKDTGMPFYVGVGTKPKRFGGIKTEYNRAYDLYKSGKRSEFWKAVFEKCGGIEVDILFESNSQEEIDRKEKEFIALYGRQDLGTGTLVNLTDGGRGLFNANTNTIERVRKACMGRKPTLGMKFGEETRQRMRQAQLGKTLSEEHKKKISVAHQGKIGHSKGKKLSPEHRLNISNSLKGHAPAFAGMTHSDKTKERISQANKGRQTALGRKATPETKAKLSAVKKGNKYFLGKSHSKEVREKISIARKGIVFSEETKLKMSIAAKHRKKKST